MSWLARSLANSLKLENEEEPERNQQQPPEAADALGRGVKDDLSQLTKTFTRQLWGVASFLAPPPSAEPAASLNPQTSHIEPSISSEIPDSPPLKDESPSDSPRFVGIRNDFAEIGGRFKTGISKLSNHKAVSEISKLASSFLPFGSEEEIDDDWSLRSVGDAVGVTDEVLAFARNISMHPETWLDFPLFLDDEDADGW